MSLSTPSNQYLVLFRHHVDLPDPTPEEMNEIITNIMAWFRAMKARGEFVGTHPLGDEGRVLRGPGGAEVTDGPFVEAKEVVGGYVIVNAPDLDTATEIARGCPNLGRITVEIRQLRNLPPI
jgi:hypothetical protein